MYGLSARWKSNHTKKKNSKRSTLKSNALNPLMSGGNKKVTHT